MKTVIEWIILLSFVCLFILSWDCENKKTATIQKQQLQISILEEQVYWLRQVNDLSKVLEQVLTPLQIQELKVLNEQITQGLPFPRSDHPN